MNELLISFFNALILIVWW